MEEDPKEKLGTLARAAILTQEKINALKKRIELFRTRSVKKTDLEIELSVLEKEQSTRLSEIDEVRQTAETFSTRKPCFVQV